MEEYRFHHHRQYRRLADRALFMNGSDGHLQHLIRSDSRMADFSASGGGMFFDYSRQRVDETTMTMLFELAEAAARRKGQCHRKPCRPSHGGQEFFRRTDQRGRQGC